MSVIGMVGKQSFFVLTCLVVLLSSCAENVDPPKAYGPLPSQKQLDWHEMEFYGFVHFSLNTFTNKEWGFGDESPEIFKPSELDTRQWARVAKEAGMKGIIFTAKHHDGFCLWPSEYTEHSVKNSPWKNGQGDVVRELAEACREYGLKLGLYLSPWDRNHPEYGRPEYIKYFRNQLKELLTNYGDVFEMWFDGANGGNGYYGGANETRKINTLEYYDWERTYDSIYQWSPETLVWGVGPSEARWIGNEEGRANKTNWSLLRQKDELEGKVHYKEFMSGHEDGERWVPGEADVSIRPGWFYHEVEDDKVRPLDEMVDIYYESVGRNANLLLNLPVDRRGLVHENDQARLQELVAVLKKDFESDVLINSKVTASNVRGGSRQFSPKNVLDGDKGTYWAVEDSMTTAYIQFDFDSITPINRIMLQEHIKLGQRVREFNVEVKVDGSWRTLANETTIGYKRILRTDRVLANAIRINITDSKACPVIQSIKAFNAPTLVRQPEIHRSKEGLISMSGSGNIFYTVDGTIPSERSMLYNLPFHFVEAVTIRAISRNKEGEFSEVKTISYGVSKANWKVINVKGGNIDNAINIIDGDLETTWSSKGNEKLPYHTVIDMGKINTISGFNYMPKQVGNGLGLIAYYEFYTSENGRDWTLCSQGEFSNIKHNPILQVKMFDKTVNARYLKFVAKSEVEEGDGIAIAELGILN